MQDEREQQMIERQIEITQRLSGRTLTPDEAREIRRIADAAATRKR